jgi:hypothetical protein
LLTGKDHPLKILFSARDPAAAHAVGNLVKQACSDSRFSPWIIASPPASELLEGLPCECFVLSKDISTTPDLLNSSVNKLLEQLRPDAVITGASGPDAGVDEVLVKLAGGIRSYVVQDFWGDVNLTLNAPPDCYLVVDHLAAELTGQRVDSETSIVGSVKHASYGELDVSMLRASRRVALEVGEDELVIGYFGMPLGHLEGYWRTLETLAESIQGWPITLIYRPHPKEEKHVRDRTCDILNRVVGFSVDKSSCVEKTLAACDLILSCYSSCGIDSEMLGRNLAQDNRLSIFLLYDAEILEYYQRYTRLNDLPLSLQKRSLTIKDRSALRETLDAFLSVESRLDYLSSEFRLPSGGESVYRVLDKVYQDCRS